VSKQVNQTFNAPVVGNVSGGAVRVANTTVNNHHQHTHHHNHSHTHMGPLHAHGPVHLHTHVETPAFALQAPPAPPAHFRQRGQPATEITPAQKALLALMRPLPKNVRAHILEFMRLEFGTGLVMELDPQELQQLRRRVLDARRESGISS
jgi:hypothetical protein